jgi:hypothetical protein
MYTKLLLENLVSKDHLREPAIDLKTDLQDICYKGVDLDSFGSEQGQW